MASERGRGYSFSIEANFYRGFLFAMALHIVAELCLVLGMVEGVTNCSPGVCMLATRFLEELCLVSGSEWVQLEPWSWFPLCHGCHTLAVCFRRRAQPDQPALPAPLQHHHHQRVRRGDDDVHLQGHHGLARRRQVGWDTFLLSSLYVEYIWVQVQMSRAIMDWHVGAWYGVLLQHISWAEKGVGTNF